MAFNIGAIVSVSGEREFNTAMKNMQQNMKYVSAEANAAMSVFGKNEKSVESLTARNSELKKALDVQRQGVINVKTELDRLIAAGLNPTSEKYKQLKANLDNVTASANNTEREIKDNEQAMANLNKQGTGLGDMLSSLTQKFGISLPKGTQDSLNSMATLDSKMLGSIAVYAAVATAIYKIEEALVNMTLAQATAIDKMLQQSSVSGIGADQLQEYAYMAELIDVPIETITGSLTKMIRSMNDARKGTGDAAEAFKTLRVRVTDSHKQLRDQNDVFDEVIDKLGRMQNETERDALSMQIFGRSARDLNPMLDAGSEKIEAYREECRKMGYGLDELSRQKLAKVDDAVQTLNNQITASKNIVAVEFAPALEKFLQAGQGVFESLGKFAEESGLVDILASILELVTAVAPAFETVGKIIGPMIGTVLKPLALALAVVADALTVVVNMIASFVEGIRMLFGVGSMDALNRYAANVERVFSNKGATAMTFNNLYNDQVKKYATGTLSHPGGLALVGDGGPELVDLRAGARVYNNQDTRRILSSGGGNTTFYVTIDAKNVREFNDVVRLARGARQAGRAR
jgi:hypothetical protein